MKVSQRNPAYVIVNIYSPRSHIYVKNVLELSFVYEIKVNSQENAFIWQRIY